MSFHGAKCTHLEKKPSLQNWSWRFESNAKHSGLAFYCQRIWVSQKPLCMGIVSDLQASWFKDNTYGALFHDSRLWWHFELPQGEWSSLQTYGSAVDPYGCNFQLFIRNKKVFKIESFAASILSAPRFLTAVRFLGNITNTRANISAHYDIGNTMSVSFTLWKGRNLLNPLPRFTAFLSHDMNYSSAIFKDFNEDINGTQSEHAETLEDAQIRKMKWVCCLV